MAHEFGPSPQMPGDADRPSHDSSRAASPRPHVPPVASEPLTDDESTSTAVAPRSEALQQNAPAAMSSLQPITVSTAALALLCAMLWGGTSVAIQFAQDNWPPLLTASARFGLGSICIALWFWWDGQPLAVQTRQWKPILIAGALLAIQIGLFHWGHTFTSAAHGQVLIGSNPVWVALLAHFLLAGDRLTLWKTVGLSLSAVGVVAVVLGASGGEGEATHVGSLAGDIVVFISSWFLASKIVYTKHALGTVEPAKLVLWSNLVGTSILLTVGLATEPIAQIRFHTASMLALLYQGVVVAGFCFAAWTMLLRRHRASQLAVFGFAQPLFGILFGVFLRGNHVTPWLLAGGAAVATGIIIVTRERTEVATDSSKP